MLTADSRLKTRANSHFLEWNMLKVSLFQHQMWGGIWQMAPWPSLLGILHVTQTCKYLQTVQAGQRSGQDSRGLAENKQEGRGFSGTGTLESGGRGRSFAEGKTSRSQRSWREWRRGEQVKQESWQGFLSFLPYGDDYNQGHQLWGGGNRDAIGAIE